ncbi:MAG: hypothetical protein HY296_04610 [Thaumarchaeota archaeon]|nr:hypothetical protein [Nitrososphaerota archaeon]
MLYEDDVKHAVAKFLRENHCRKVRTIGLHEHGLDLSAEFPDGRALWVEAKGETSSTQGSPYYGNPFNSSQRSDHFGKALLKCLQFVSEGKGRVVAGLALPSEGNTSLVDSVKPVLRRLRIAVFLVNHDLQVVTPLGIPWEKGKP